MPKYYLLDENKNLVEGFDKEGFLALLQQAIDQGSLENIDPESAVASKLRSVLNGTTHHIEFVTEAQYNQLEHDGELVENTYYFITDDSTLEDLEEEINSLTQRINDLGFKQGAFIVSGISPELILTNSLVKQGKRVIANLEIGGVPFGSGIQSGIISIPSNFMPNAHWKSEEILINYNFSNTANVSFHPMTINQGISSQHPELPNFIDFGWITQNMGESLRNVKIINGVWETD